jgi:hypothetical protein
VLVKPEEVGLSPGMFTETQIMQRGVPAPYPPLRRELRTLAYSALVE